MIAIGNQNYEFLNKFDQYKSTYIVVLNIILYNKCYINVKYIAHLLLLIVKYLLINNFIDISRLFKVLLLAYSSSY
jgi:hypothetical protein